MCMGSVERPVKDEDVLDIFKEENSRSEMS